MSGTCITEVQVLSLHSPSGAFNCSYVETKASWIRPDNLA